MGVWVACGCMYGVYGYMYGVYGVHTHAHAWCDVTGRLVVERRATAQIPHGQEAAADLHRLDVDACCRLRHARLAELQLV